LNLVIVLTRFLPKSDDCITFLKVTSQFVCLFVFTFESETVNLTPVDYKNFF